MISEFTEIKRIFIPALRLSFVTGPSELPLRRVPGAPEHGSPGAQNAASVPKTLQAGLSLFFRALFASTIPSAETEN